MNTALKPHYLKMDYIMQGIAEDLVHSDWHKLAEQALELVEEVCQVIVNTTAKTLDDVRFKDDICAAIDGNHGFNTFRGLYLEMSARECAETLVRNYYLLLRDFATLERKSLIPQLKSFYLSAGSVYAAARALHKEHSYR